VLERLLDANSPVNPPQDHSRGLMSRLEREGWKPSRSPTRTLAGAARNLVAGQMRGVGVSIPRSVAQPALDCPMNKL
jgi:hypothetical protein